MSIKLRTLVRAIIREELKRAPLQEIFGFGMTKFVVPYQFTNSGGTAPLNDVFAKGADPSMKQARAAFKSSIENLQTADKAKLVGVSDTAVTISVDVKRYGDQDTTPLATKIVQTAFDWIKGQTGGVPKLGQPQKI